MMKKTHLAALSALILLAAAPQDPDRHKTATALQKEGLRYETQNPVNLARAIKKYQKSAEKAEGAGNGDVAAQSLYWMARCHEKMNPPEISSAQSAYDKIASTFSDASSYDAAVLKQKMKGVDVYLDLFYQKVVNQRDNVDDKSEKFEEIKAGAWGHIQGLDAQAVFGLIHAGLGHKDQVVRGFAAEKLPSIVNNEGIAMIIESLNSSNPKLRNGASQALQHIFERFNQAAAEDQLAEAMLKDLAMNVADDMRSKDKADSLRASTEAKAQEHKENAGRIRHNIPGSLNSSEIQSALRDILDSESADPQARQEAAKALGVIGKISGSLATALISALGSKDRNVRAGAAAAAGGVDTELSADKHKIVNRLIEIVQYEPAKDTDTASDERDWSNDDMVRANAAESLGKIGLIKSIPSLIEALADNAERVRRDANAALVSITNRDMKFEAGAHLTDDSAPKTKDGDPMFPDRLSREAAAQKWQEWWDETNGVVVLVERFEAFVNDWKRFRPERLFDEESFLKEIRAQSWAMSSDQAEDRLNRAKKAVEIFQETKKLYQQDAIDVGESAVEKLMPFISGQTSDSGKDNAAVRKFVAETIAKLGGGELSTLRSLVLDTGGAKGAGAALAIGFRDRSDVDSEMREILQVHGVKNPDIRVQTASAEALGRVGTTDSSLYLAQAAEAADILSKQGRRLAVECLKAIGRIGAGSKEAVETLGFLIGDEPEGGGAGRRSKNDLVREYAADALGLIGDPAALLYLIRARRDVAKNVREASGRALKKIYDRNQQVREEAEKILRQDEEQFKSDDRLGAALALGDMGDDAAAKTLIFRVINEQSPRLMKDTDARVRAAACDSLGRLGTNAAFQKVIEGLIEAMQDKIQEVRIAAYTALRSVVGTDVAATKKFEVTLVDSEGNTRTENTEFRGDLPLRADRDKFVREWKSWFRDNKGNYKADM